MKPTLLAALAIMPFAQTATVLSSNTDTALFYLVSSSTNAASNLLPLRTVGGASGYSTLTGSGPIGQFYFSQGKLMAVPPPGSSMTQRPLIGAIPSSTGCTTYGPLGFTQGSSSDKCAKYDSFYIQSESQLGTQLSFNFLGGFYACGSNQDVWYTISSSSIPPGIICDPISLWTVPV